MKVFTASQIRDIDAYTIQNEPILPVNLMERAAGALTREIVRMVDRDKPIKIFAGSGNNGGDGLALARLLTENGFRVEVFLFKNKDLSADCAANLKRLEKLTQVNIHTISIDSAFPKISKNDIVIDGLFGTGLSRPLEGVAAGLVKHMNHSGAFIISIDVPSGLFCEDNSLNKPDNIIKANLTLSFQFPKLSFFFPENERYTGKWKILPIGLHPAIINSTPTPYHYLTKEEITPMLRSRNAFAHKGHFGHSLIVSGSIGKMGAAILASKACLRAGSGLVTAHIPRCGLEIIQSSLPEVMVSIDLENACISDIKDIQNYKAIGIGPGLGTDNNTQIALRNFFQHVDKPIVIDADGLNILALHPDWLNLIPEGSILTPHPKEFERLAGQTENTYKRVELQRQLAIEYKLFILVKGAYSAIACPDGTCIFNSSGNPGMATAGSGDVLTGILTGLLSQGYTPEEAVKIGVYLHGLAGDLASEKYSQEAMIAGDIIECMGDAYKKMRIQ